MGTEFERKVIKKLSEIEEVVKGLDTLNRNIEKQNQNIEKLIKVLIEEKEKEEQESGN